jgi:hypothetical protein
VDVELAPLEALGEHADAFDVLVGGRTRRDVPVGLLQAADERVRAVPMCRDEEVLDVVQDPPGLLVAFGVLQPAEEVRLDLVEHDDVLPERVVGIDEEVLLHASSLAQSIGRAAAISQGQATGQIAGSSGSPSTSAAWCGFCGAPRLIEKTASSPA